jgi:hypothetical protein
MMTNTGHLADPPAPGSPPPIPGRTRVSTL